MPLEIDRITVEEPKNPGDERQFTIRYAKMPGPWDRPRIYYFEEVLSETQMQEKIRHGKELLGDPPTTREKIIYTSGSALVTAAIASLLFGVGGAIGGGALGGYYAYKLVTAGHNIKEDTR